MPNLSAHLTHSLSASLRAGCLKKNGEIKVIDFVTFVGKIPFKNFKIISQKVEKAKICLAKNSLLLTEGILL